MTNLGKKMERGTYCFDCGNKACITLNDSPNSSNPSPLDIFGLCDVHLYMDDDFINPINKGETEVIKFKKCKVPERFKMTSAKKKFLSKYM